MAPRRPKGTGRKKIEIRRIESKQGRQVCFSKRRVGLFKKASELATICDVKVAAVAFSPGGNVFTFGHPSVESVLDHFTKTQVAEEAGGGDGGELNQALADLNQEQGEVNQELADLYQENYELRGRLEAEQAREKAAEEVLAKARAEGCQTTTWLDGYATLMGEKDLVPFEAVMAKVHAAVAAGANRLRQQALLLHFTVRGGGGGFPIGGTNAGLETLHKLDMMMGMPPPPGYASGMEMALQGFGPHGFPQ
ncbi:hypothetical protein ACQ4PT_046336 [Festuca glaucescens]